MSALGQTPATPARGFSGRRVLFAGLGILVVALGLIAIPALTYERQDPELPDYGMVPAFELVDHTGAAFTPLAMAGHATVVNFIFTRCDMVCPTSSAKMLEVQERTVDLGPRVQMVSFSVDPSHDTPEVLAAYGRDFHQDPARWTFVTGPLATMRPLVEGAFMTAMDDLGLTPRGTPNIWHGESFLLIDRDLHIRGVYRTDAPGLDLLIRHARYLARGGR